ncbi:MAG: NAD kinase [Paracoccaceae bacterium]|jgi:NAD+ kinase|nr:NAD kinase [Paracoccaceae bacterium]MDG2429911.1 NAD kinase [Paracoccaceae bacterium]|tara:strand:+ start:111 stop:872 length:762 start_codon:yes stop_codon:yes gene_type:complete
MSEKIAFLAADTDSAQAALHELTEIYGQCDFKTADYIVALGGDGFMLQTLHLCQNLRAPVYGMNRGTVGFMMNAYEIKALPLRLANAEQQIINPLIMKATLVDGKVETALAINEVSLLRAGPQAAKLKIWVDNRQRMDELVCDGVLVATPAGSTAYNYSAHGPILPIGADVLAMTALNAYRPRRWRGALLPKTSIVRIDVLDNKKRPVMADADSVSFKNVKKVEISSETKIKHKILFNQGHGLDERLIQEQFV